LKTLIVTVGLPRSGKSTWAKTTGFPVVNPDSIRMALYGQEFLVEAEDMIWTLSKYMVKSLFIAGHDTVILDATNLTDHSRDFWISKEWDVEWKIFDTDVEICKQRAIEGGKEKLIPIIEKMNRFKSIPTEKNDPLGVYVHDNKT